MDIKKIQDANVENKRVILRVDFNVSVENGKAKEVFKIKAAKESLDYLLSKNAKVAIMTYFGRPEGKVDPKFSMEQLVLSSQEVLGVKIKFVSDCIGEKVKEGLNNLQDREVLLLENVRFYPGEESNDAEFAKQLGENFDIFVNDAFGQSHRQQASISGVTKFVPSFAGFCLQKEIENLDKVKNNPIKPAVAIIGGAKIETKLPVIKFFEEKYDYVLVGGKIANEAIDQGISFSGKVILPEDFEGGTGERFDIGPKTREKFSAIIKSAKTIVWNGPVGKFEEEAYAKGTQTVFEAVVQSDAYTLVGGGETLEILEKNNAMDKISFVSTGGGAMLEYLGGGKMPGIEALEVNR